MNWGSEWDFGMTPEQLEQCVRRIEIDWVPTKVTELSPEDLEEADQSLLFDAAVSEMVERWALEVHYFMPAE